MWNTVKTTLLLATLTGLFLVIGNAIGGQLGLIIALVFAAVFNMGAWWFSGDIALRMSGAHEVSRAEAPELYSMVETLAKRADLPMPKVCIINSPIPNAFATGRDPQHSAVAATTGIMQILNRDELAGVMAHELAHIKNRDTLISSISATIAGAIAGLADMLMWGMIFAGLSGEDDEGGGLAGLASSLVLIIVAPLAATIIQLAISRSREFGADAGGARILGDPVPLARALEKLERAAHSMNPMHVNPATSHLYIVNPLRGGVAGLFSTHPATQKRIERLMAMKQSGSAVLA